MIDTNIVIFYIKGKFNLAEKFNTTHPNNCYISEITLAELKFGIENSANPTKNRKVLSNFLTDIKILPIYHSLDLFAKEKARLRKLGNPIDDFDLLISVTSVEHNLMMVTNNTKHFERINKIELEDSTKENHH